MCCHFAGFATKSGRKSPIAAVSGAGGVGGHDSKMISRVRSQARDVRSDVLIIIASFGLVRRSVSVADGSLLKIDRCAALAEFRSIVNDFAQA
jgi:hypothetical protein